MLFRLLVNLILHILWNLLTNLTNRGITLFYCWYVISKWSEESFLYMPRSPLGTPPALPYKWKIKLFEIGTIGSIFHVRTFGLEMNRSKVTLILIWSRDPNLTQIAKKHTISVQTNYNCIVSICLSGKMLHLPTTMYSEHLS